jgi:hypothetical protein
MATLVFSTIGTALGGPLGGAIGALAGRQLDGTLFGPGARNGPRLRELDVSLSSYGVALPRIHGRMRVAGAIIWATELQEHSQFQGGAKGQGAVNAFSYTANLAVAVSSRPITGIGRIWADGKLLRGAAGDLKTGGIVRVHTGSEEQAVDPLIAASEGEARCPAFRGLAYVVFEALDLTDFGNRIPALTFEVLADEGVRLHDILGERLPDVSILDDIGAFTGFAVEDNVGTSIALIDAVVPIRLDAAGDTIVAHVGSGSARATMLDAAAISVEDDAFGASDGYSLRRASAERAPPAVLRYFDRDRDFQPGLQHAVGRTGQGQPDVIELPATLDASTARDLIDAVTRRRDGTREQVAWRTATLDAAVGPGSLVRLPGRAGTWCVESWEWREAGVELELTRVVSSLAPAATNLAAAPFAAPLDAAPAATRLVAFELPFDGTADAADRPRLCAAVGADGANWSGAALFADRGDGQLWPFGAATRHRAIVGTTLDALGPANPLLFDRAAALTVVLPADQALHSASVADLAAGANLALVGDELIQFAKAEPLGAGHWRLTGLLRGNGGTETAVVGHLPAEPFAIVDARLTTWDGSGTGIPGVATIVAPGRGDSEPAVSSVRLAGIGLRPLAPVHARVIRDADGGLQLAWTRRARGGWAWRDGADMPMVEESERYLVTYEAEGRTLRSWSVATPSLTLGRDELEDLVALGRGHLFARQQGTHAVSHALPLTALA